MCPSWQMAGFILHLEIWVDVFIYLWASCVVVVARLFSKLSHNWITSCDAQVPAPARKRVRTTTKKISGASGAVWWPIGPIPIKSVMPTSKTWSARAFHIISEESFGLSCAALMTRLPSRNTLNTSKPRLPVKRSISLSLSSFSFSKLKSNMQWFDYDRWFGAISPARIPNTISSKRKMAWARKASSTSWKPIRCTIVRLATARDLLLSSASYWCR